jgi:uncharacterized protein
MVHRLNNEISGKIGCTICGNCCGELKPCITNKDIVRLAHILAIKPKEVKANYTETDDGDLYFKNLPCSFLKDKKCTIYNDRPVDCQSCPHLHKKDFTSRLFTVIQNYSVCP